MNSNFRVEKLKLIAEESEALLKRSQVVLILNFGSNKPSDVTELKKILFKNNLEMLTLKRKGIQRLNLSGSGKVRPFGSLIDCFAGMVTSKSDSDFSLMGWKAVLKDIDKNPNCHLVAAHWQPKGWLHPSQFKDLVKQPSLEVQMDLFSSEILSLVPDFGRNEEFFKFKEALESLENNN